jgi:hypothetical protein
MDTKAVVAAEWPLALLYRIITTRAVGEDILFKSPCSLAREDQLSPTFSMPVKENPSIVT